MKFFKILVILSHVFMAISCSMQSEEEITSQDKLENQRHNSIVVTDLKLLYQTEEKYKQSNTPEFKFFHLKACFKKRLPERKLSDEPITIVDFKGAKPPVVTDIDGCAEWVEEVEMDYSKTNGVFLRERVFKFTNSNESKKLSIYLDQYKNKIFLDRNDSEKRETGKVDVDAMKSEKGLIVQSDEEQHHTLASDPIKETGDIQVLSNQDGHIPFVKYRVALLIPNRIATNYERLQGEPIQVRLHRVDDLKKTYIPVKELEGGQVKSAPYGATNVAFDLEYNRYSPLRWIPYELEITPLNKAFKNKGLTVNLCIKPWEGQKFSVYDATTYGSCPEPDDKSLLTKNPEIYFNHVSFKQLGQVESGYKLDEYLDISLRKKWRVTVMPYVNYWHNFESNNHFFPLLSGNFKIKVILMAYKKGDTLELTQEDLDKNNFDVIGYAESEARINKGNLISDIELDFPFQKWYRIYTRTFAAIQVVPIDEELNPYLKSGVAVIPFHAADRDYSIYVKTDRFTKNLDSVVEGNIVTENNFAKKSADMELASGSSITKVEKITSDNTDKFKGNIPLSSADAEKSKGKVVFQDINRKFFVDNSAVDVIKKKLSVYFDNSSIAKNWEVGSGRKYKESPEKTAVTIMNSSPVYKDLERTYVDTKEGNQKLANFLNSFLDVEELETPVVNPYGLEAPPVFVYENNYKGLNFSKWATEGLDVNAKQIFCRFFIRNGGAARKKLENGKYSKFFDSFIYKKCMEKPEVFIHVDSISYINKVNSYKFSTGMEIHHNLDRRVYLFNSYNDRESMSGRINLALGFEKTNPGKILKGMDSLKNLTSPIFNRAKAFLGIFNVNFGGYDIGRYWGLDHSIGLSETVAKSENVSLVGTKHDVTIDADIRECSIVRFKMPDEIMTSFTYFDRSDFVSFSNMFNHQLTSLSLFLGIDLGKRDTPREQYEEAISNLADENDRKFYSTIMRRFEFCNSKISKNQKINESWYYLGSDLGYHSGTLDPLSIRHNPFMKLVRGTKNFDEVIDHLSHSLEATFIEEAKKFESKDNIGELVKKIYQTPKYGYPPSLGEEVVNMVGLPGLVRRKVPTDNPYYVQNVKYKKTFLGNTKKVILDENGQVERIEEVKKEEE